ncbi:MAG: cytochrome c nitrite reductase small subunit [bacterium]|nr:cytochrome c nitrite reductase small subunit [bacterium]
MLENKKARYALFAGIAFILFLFVFWGPPALLEKTSTPDFCNSCHVMNYQHEDWFMTGLHRNIRCVDCHLPNNNALNHFIWKGIDGMKDVIYFHTNIFSEPIEISSHGKKAIQENCIRCHDGMVTMINVEERNCWDCHRRVHHKVTGITTREIK